MKACLELKRNCIGIEINPEYIEIAKKRLNWGSSLGNVEFRFYKEDEVGAVGLKPTSPGLEPGVLGC